MKNINWTTQSGTKIEITLEAVFGLDLQGRRKTAGIKTVEMSAKVTSHRTFGGIQAVKGHATCVASIGDIRLTAAQLEMITAAESEIGAEIEAANAAIKNHAASLDALGNGDIDTTFGANA